MDQQEIGANASSGAGQKSSSESQLQHHTSTENAVNNSGQLSQQQPQQQPQQHYSLTSDVRMKRHPELQPYIPCDRFVPTITPARSNVKNSFGGSSNLATTGHGYTGLSKDNNCNNKPKKYVSMTRLNQLAQPKRRTQQQQPTATSTVPPSSLTSSNATSTTASSLASSRNYSCNSGKSSASTNATTKQQHLQPRPPSLPSQVTQTRRLSSNSLKSNKPLITTTNTTRARDSTSSTKSSTPLVGGRNVSQQQQQKSQISSKTPHTSHTTATTSIRRISRQSLKESTPLRHDLTFDSSNKPVGEDAPISPIKVMSTASQQEVTPKVELDDDISTKNHQISSIDDSQDDGSLTRQRITSANGSQQQLLVSNNISDRSSANHVNDNSSNFASIRQANDDGSTSLADQLSELSVNDRHFQSAASELLVPEHFQFSESLSNNRNASSLSQHASQNNQSSTTNNGTVNLSDRNPDSLLRELQNDIMAKGFAFDQTTNGENFDGATTPRASVANELLADNVLLQQHESTATLWRPEKASTNTDHDDQNLNTPRAENGVTTATAAANAWQLSERLRREREDAEEEERKLKSEEYLREKARREEEEREKRGKLVESILSRFSQGSP